MLLDKQLQFSAAQNLASATSTPSTNVVDLGAKFDPGAGHPVYVYAQVNTVATATTTASDTITLSLQSSADEAFTTAVTVATLTAALKSADLTPAGKELVRLAIPRSAITSRYLRLYNTISGTFTQLKLDASLVLGLSDAEVSYPAQAGG